MIKSYTNIEQSKVLAKILSAENADNTWEQIITPGPLVENINELKFRHIEIPFKLYSGIGYPCWSLAALLEVIPSMIEISKDGLYFASYNSVCSVAEYTSGEYDNPIDACYETILKLHEEKLL